MSDGESEAMSEAAASRLLARLAIAEPTSIGAIDQYGALSYGQLLARVEERAAALPTNTGLACLEASPTNQWLIAYLACWRRGLPVLMIPRGDAYAMSRLCEQFRPTILLREENDYTPELLPKAAQAPIHPELALMLSTSGSTGDAKCVKLSHANVAANANSIVEYLGLTSADRGLANLPVHYSYGLSIVHSHLWAGATILFTEHSVIDDVFWTFAQKHEATSFAGVPHVYELLQRVDLETRAPPSLRYFTQAGGRLRPDLVSHFADIAARRDWRFFVMYGQTEATARIAYVPPDVTRERPGVIGKAIPGGKLSVQDQTGTELPHGAEGELVYEGANVMMGYASASTDLAAPPTLTKLVTGDLAVQDPDGLFRITGRKARFIKLFGARVSLDSVERRLEEWNVTGAAAGADDQLLVAIQDQSAVELIRDKLSDWLNVPLRHIVVVHVAELPRLASGKTDYAQLNMLATPEATSEVSSLSVLSIFQAAFPEALPDDSDSFESLGGDSLSYVSVALELERLVHPLPGDWAQRPIIELSALSQTPDTIPRKPNRSLLSSMQSGRGLACLLVVYAHVIGFAPDQGLGLADDHPLRVSVEIFDFLRMPLFLALSGFVYAAMLPAPGTWTRFTKSKLIQLGIPLAFATFVFWMLRGLTSGAFDDIVRAYVWGYQHLWFLGSLLVIMIAAAAIDSVLKAPKQVWWFILLVVALAAPFAPDIQVLHFENTISLLPFFIIGTLIQRYPAMFSSRPTLIVAVLLTLFIFVSQTINVANGRGPYDGIWMSGYIFTTGVIVLLLNTLGRVSWLALIALYSFTIYLWHPIPNAAVREALQAIGISTYWIIVPLGFAAGVVIPIMIHKISVRIPIVRTLMTGR